MQPSGAAWVSIGVPMIAQTTRRPNRVSIAAAILALCLGMLAMSDAAVAAPGETRLISKSVPSVTGACASINPLLSATGRFVAFRSCAPNIVAGDTNQHSDIFIADQQTGATTRIDLESSYALDCAYYGCVPYSYSLSSDGRFVAIMVFYHSEDASFRVVMVHDRQAGTTATLNRAYFSGFPASIVFNVTISANGRYVAFVARRDDVTDIADCLCTTDSPL